MRETFQPSAKSGHSGVSIAMPSIKSRTSTVLIVKTNTVARSHTERGILWVRRADEQGTEALSVDRVVVQVEFEFRHTFLGKTDRPLSTGNHVREAHFAPASHPRGFNHSLSAIHKTHHGMGLIFVFNRHSGAGANARRACHHDGFQITAYLRYFPTRYCAMLTMWAARSPSAPSPAVACKQCQ